PESGTPPRHRPATGDRDPGTGRGTPPAGEFRRVGGGNECREESIPSRVPYAPDLPRRPHSPRCGEVERTNPLVGNPLQTGHTLHPGTFRWPAAKNPGRRAPVHSWQSVLLATQDRLAPETADAAQLAHDRAAGAAQLRGDF